MLTDCTMLNGTGNSCIVDGVNTTAKCAVDKAWTTKPLPALLTDGKIGDGLRGSLCALSFAPKPTPPCSDNLVCAEFESGTPARLSASGPLRTHVRTCPTLCVRICLERGSRAGPEVTCPYTCHVHRGVGRSRVAGTDGLTGGRG